MDRYRAQALAAKVARVSQEIVGMKMADASAYCTINGLKDRVYSIDGKSCMHTQDVKMDRIGLVVENGIVTDTRNG